MNYAIVFRLLGYVLMIEGALLLLPAAAHADGYSMSQTYIGATVEADGSLTVVEGRQFDFDDDITGVAALCGCAMR